METRMTLLRISRITLRVADNHRIKLEGCWKGKAVVVGVTADQGFEVFESHRVFEIILGKPWLQSVNGTHRYTSDEITIKSSGRQATLANDGKDMATLKSAEREERRERTQEQEPPTPTELDARESPEENEEGEMEASTKSEAQQEEEEAGEWENIVGNRRKTCQRLENSI
jgi:Mg-chelatase subunit ChlI